MNSKYCAGSENGQNNAFDPDLSSTYEPTNLGCEVEFGSGSVRGFFAKDDVAIGAAHMDPNG